MAEILCSTGAIIGMPNGRDYRLLKDIVPQLECDGLEFMMYSTWYDRVEEIVAFLKDQKYNIPVLHCAKSVGEGFSAGDDASVAESFRLFEANARLAADIGADRMVMHLWNGIVSDQHIENNYRAYERLREIADKYGVDLLVENVVCNVQNPYVHWDELMKRYPDVHFVYDTKMAEFHGQTEELYTEERAELWRDGHIRHYHVNDYLGGVMDWSRLRTLPVGDGQIDFDRFFDFIKRIGYNGTFTLESTVLDKTGFVNTGAINRQAEYIRNRMEV